MITLIGTSESIIGFGLCGIKKIHEVTLKITDEKLLSLVENAESKVIVIDEILYGRIQQAARGTDKVFVQIPDPMKEHEDDIDELVRDTIGVSVRVTQ